MFLLTACGGSAVDDNLVDCRCVLANGKRQTANGKRQTAREEAHLRRWPLQGKRRSAEQCQTHDGHLNMAATRGEQRDKPAATFRESEERRRKNERKFWSFLKGAQTCCAPYVQEVKGSARFCRRRRWVSLRRCGLARHLSAGFRNRRPGAVCRFPGRR